MLVPFRIRVEAPLRRVPAAVRRKLDAILELVARDLEGISSGGPLFESLAQSGLVVDVHGWRFGYRVDRDRRALIVESVVSLEP